MENMKIQYNRDYEQLSNKDYKKSFVNNAKYCFSKNICFIITLINSLIIFYLILENKKIKYLIDDINDIKDELLKNILIKNKNIDGRESKAKENIVNINKDMIGMKYPEIDFEKTRNNLNNLKLISSLSEFMEQLEIKLIYLEKEINVTKLTTFYTSRKLVLDKLNVKYGDSNIKELHDIISWLVIHKSTQLKGIASDKYLACEYIKIKFNEDLCKQRIRAYNNVEEIDFKNIKKFGNIVLKISNGCGDKIFIYNNSVINIEEIKKKLKKNFNKDYGLANADFFHLYSQKRIVLEKIFLPLSDLYEFKFYVVNHNINMIYIRATINDKIHIFIYDSNFNLIEENKKFSLDLSKFSKNELKNLKKYAVKLSEDFPNFVRVDLYLFHNKIYLSELTFDPQNGKPFMRNQQVIQDAAKNWIKID